jgi:hypothetical protein
MDQKKKASVASGLWPRSGERTPNQDIATSLTIVRRLDRRHFCLSVVEGRRTAEKLDRLKRGETLTNNVFRKFDCSKGRYE